MKTKIDSKNSKIGVLLVGHGSRLPYGKEVLCNLAEMYREKSEFTIEIGFMNMAKPSIPTAINSLAKKGVKKIIVTPVFVAHGVHTKKDIPHILGLETRHDHSHDHHEEENEEIIFKGQIIYTEPLGADSRIVDIIKERVESAI